MAKKTTTGGEDMNSENVEAPNARCRIPFRNAGHDDPSAGERSTELRSALLTPYRLIEGRQCELERFEGMARQNAALMEQLALINSKLDVQIAERKQAEEALRQAQADLAHANRMSSLGELTASLAHELRQPIAAVIIDASACLRWLSRDRPDLQEACAAASRAVQDGMHADEIVKGVRHLFQKDTLKRELLDLNEVLREMILLLHSEATRHRILVRAKLAAKLPKVMGDRVQLQQVLINLMKNSIDAMEDVDGTRELTIQSQHGEDGQILISVSDTGVGLPPQKAEKIFDAFFTTKPNGSGMGLRISRSIVESHSGRLWAAANDGRGATFYFTLRAAAEEVKVPAEGM
jgi:C4-dicarboxylate-specific signal transduction histidine kinase